ncbi:MAG: hypothetical protein JWN03_4510 [Nocardia sp.]|uniref:hypothetical protein n=1 Tax=Nocardia sp. TaxID=1821 RepID=UPI002610EFF9|nr:hypothetical protein [Nocardia sp.]MCU1644235.1 hypothetical protein [Nocardia sp.]
MPLLTIRLAQNATLEIALRTLGLAVSEVDAGYGLVSLDPVQGLYALRVTDSAAARLATADDEGVGIFADPRIEPIRENPESPE